MKCPAKFPRPYPGFWLLVFFFLIPFLPAGNINSETPQRIISLAPSITEILFELDLGGQVVGVTDYCDYPAAVKTIAKVGGLFDPAYEEIVGLRPDLVILLTSHGEVKPELEKLNLRTLTVPHLTLEDIHASIRMIGEACGKKTEAAKLVNALEDRFTAVRKVLEGRPVPRVLLCIGRDTDSGRLGSINIAGGNDFYDAILEAAGGQNVYAGAAVSYPQLSAESIIGLNPDIIIDLVSQIRPGGKTALEIGRQWEHIPSLSAVQEGRVHVITGNQALRPGPRYIEFLEELAHVLHPESFAKVSLNE